MSGQVLLEIEGLTTEALHPRSADLDVSATKDVLEFMNAEDAGVAAAVRRVLPEIEKAVDLAVASLRGEGRLIYIGAGTSGRLGVLDAAECPPTFGSDPAKVLGIMAGGREAVFLSQEGAEDRREQGGKDLESVGVKAGDTVIGITASRRTPYVLGALEYAKAWGAATVFLICNPPPEANSITANADVIIAPVLGPEVVMGSTRLKAGTATKMILNMISTAAFVRLGKVYQGMMVDLKAGSEKLKARSLRVLMLATGTDLDRASEILRAAEGSVKTAIVMAQRGVDRATANRLLDEAQGSVREAILP